MSAAEQPSWHEKNRVLVAVYPDEKKSKDIVQNLIDRGYPMDRIAVLGRINAVGDDNFGIYTLNASERIKTWGEYGIFWGGLWGLLAGASGVFMLPGVGLLAAAGYIVEAIVGGAAITGGAMAGAAALSQLAVAFHRSGIPAEQIQSLHKAIEDGKYVLLLRGTAAELAKWRTLVAWGNPLELHDFPYPQFLDKG
ncbi:MAG TPA: hypothetical protein VFW53_03630 [Gallionella sp.]|nr:hypothetical protein [Gallionella sp.]